jgi:hypothetical protein
MLNTHIHSTPPTYLGVFTSFSGRTLRYLLKNWQHCKKHTVAEQVMQWSP